MRKLKYFVLISVFLGSLFFLFGPEVIPESSINGLVGGQELLNLVSETDVIIIFNSGGWGNTPLEEAKDFASIIEGIEKALKDFGYNSIVIPYTRTRKDFFGKIAGARDFLNSFKFSSKNLAEKVEFLNEKFPDKKIIMAGLCAGGALVEKTMKRISGQAKNSIYGILAGLPFWYKTFESENLLQLNNNGKDPLSKGEIGPLLRALIKAPFKWVLSKIKGGNLSFGQAMRIPGHEYFWSSPEVGPQIISFLKSKLKE